jgi:hypothetical protein
MEGERMREFAFGWEGKRREKENGRKKERKREKKKRGI